MTRGGRRPGSGPKRRNIVRVRCCLPRAAYDELEARVSQLGISRAQVMVRILCRELIGQEEPPRPPESGRRPQSPFGLRGALRELGSGRVPELNLGPLDFG